MRASELRGQRSLRTVLAVGVFALVGPLVGCGDDSSVSQSEPKASSPADTAESSDSQATEDVADDPEVTMIWTYDGYLLRAPDDPLREGTVTLSGAAVDAGTVCAAARAAEVSFDELPNPAEDEKTYRLRLAVTCSDGSGQFVIRDDVSLRTDGYGVPTIPTLTPADWTVIDGTGSYESLAGWGSSTAEGDEGQVTKTFIGQLSSGHDQ